MITFDFDEVSSFSIPAGGSANFSETEGGVAFTFSVSVQAGGGAVLTNNASDALAPTSSGPSFGPPVWTLTLDGSGADDSQFAGFAGTPIEIAFAGLGGSGVDVTFTNSGNTALSQTFTSFVGTNLQATGQFTGIRFTSNDPDYLVLSLTFAEVNCFCAGTQIATEDGSKSVESLKPGDKILLANGGQTQVKWLGRQTVDTRFAHPTKVNPIRIRAGALGDDLPERDLLISGDHAVALDGYLVNASALVNGTTITREPRMPIEGFTYYHIETHGHDLILAEGVAAETYVDYVCTDDFDNADDRENDRMIEEMTLPRISAARMLPQRIRRRVSVDVAA